MFLDNLQKKVKYQKIINFRGVSVTLNTDSMEEIDKISFIFDFLSELTFNKEYDMEYWNVYSLRDNITLKEIELLNIKYENYEAYDRKKCLSAYYNNMQILKLYDSNYLYTILDATNKKIYCIKKTLNFDIIHLEHVIKEPIRVILKTQKVLSVHSACCEINGQGILIVGVKGSGKTTLLFNLLNYGAFYIGNDTVRITIDDMNMFTWPSIIRIGEGTIQDNKILANFISQAPDNNIRFEISDKKYEFYPGLLNKIYNIQKIKVACHINHIVIPIFNISAKECKYECIFNEEARKELKTILTKKEQSISWLKIIDDGILSKIDDDNLEIFLSKIDKVLKFEYGPNSTTPTEKLINILKLKD